MTQTLETLYSLFTGHAPESVEALPGAGSNRSYYRLKGTPTLIGGMRYFTRRKRGLHLPVASFSGTAFTRTDGACRFHDRLCYLQDDLGTDSLFQPYRTRKRNRRV